MGRVILFPLDNSERSFAALQWALKCIVRSDDFLALLHCYDANRDTTLTILGHEGMVNSLGSLSESHYSRIFYGIGIPFSMMNSRMRREARSG
jgi:hypothetical protein